MAVDKRISYEVQGGVKNYLGKQKEVTAPVKWKSSPNHPETELAYITKAEKDLLVKKDLHGSLKGGVNRGPSGIMSLNGFGSTDPDQNVSGTQMSAAETGNLAGFSGYSGPELPPGVQPKGSQLAQDIRSAAIAAGAGQRVNPGFFDSRNVISPFEMAQAKLYAKNPNNRFAKKAMRNTRGGGLMGLLSSGGLFGSLIRGIGQGLGFGKKFNEPTYDMSQFNNLGLFSPSTNPNNLDIYNEFVTEDDEEDKEFINVNEIKNLIEKSKNKTASIGDGISGIKLADALTIPTYDDSGVSLMKRRTLYNAGYNDSQIKEALDGGYLDQLVRDIEGPIGIV